MMPEQQPDTTEPTGRSGKLRAFLLNPWTIGLEFLLIISVVAGYGIATTPQEPMFEGTATVVKIEQATKVCNIKLRHEDGTVKKHKMTQYTCKNVTEGEVIDVVAGKYVSQLASQP